MSLKPYANYKDSEVDWLRAPVPAHWTAVKLGHLAKLRSGAAIDSGLIGESGAYPVYGGGGFRGYTETFTNRGAHVLVGRQGALCGNVSLAQGSFFATEHSLVAYQQSELDTRWLAYNFEVMNLGQYSQSAAQPGLSAEVLQSKRTIAPPIREQRSIAEFLDRETAEIDAFIADQEELIALLAERRAATISHAVTKGLDPSAPMKNSGVDWLGTVPEHWRVAGLRRFAKTSSGAGFPHEYQGRVDEEFPFLKVNSLGRAGQDGIIRVADDTISRSTAATLRATIFPAGTIAIAKIGAALLLGRVRALSVASCLDNNMMGIAPAEDVEPAFLRYNIQTVRFEPLTNPGAVPSLSDSKFSSYALCWPPFEEQRLIAAHLDRETEEIDATIADAREAIALSKERRAALISAAVTGKIDVRNHGGVG